MELHRVAGSFTTRFTTSSVEGVRNINLKLGGDEIQRIRKQAATQVRLMSPDIPTLFGERNDLLNLMQFGANVSSSLFSSFDALSNGTSENSLVLESSLLTPCILVGQYSFVHFSLLDALPSGTLGNSLVLEKL